MNGHLYAKDIARMMGCHPDTFRRRESSLGLRQARVALNSRVIVYPSRAVVAALASRGLDVRALQGSGGKFR